ncbi:phage tail protein [Nocardioides marmoraquaticus]
MSHTVDFVHVSTEGLESSPHAEALAGLRANEARYFKNKYDHVSVTEPASERPDIAEYVARILAERDLAIASPPLEVTTCEVDGIRWTHVFHESGLAINVLWTLAEGGKRAVGFKLSDGMDVPDELEGRFKFARQKSKLAGTIRGSFFVIKGDYEPPRLA